MYYVLLVCNNSEWFIRQKFLYSNLLVHPDNCQENFNLRAEVGIVLFREPMYRRGTWSMVQNIGSEPRNKRDSSSFVNAIVEGAVSMTIKILWYLFWE